ncbi:MAG TPA: DUF1127 domain-containing protein [Dongiaceae bacterium]
MYRYNPSNSTIEASGEISSRRQGGLARCCRFLFDCFAVWQDRRRQRLALLRLDNRLLRDIGLSLADVEREISKPFWR